MNPEGSEPLVQPAGTSVVVHIVCLKDEEQPRP